MEHRCILSLWNSFCETMYVPRNINFRASTFAGTSGDIIIIHRNNPTTFVHPNLTEWAIQRMFLVSSLIAFPCRHFLSYLIVFLPVIIALHWTDSGRVRVIRTQSPSPIMPYGQSIPGKTLLMPLPLCPILAYHMTTFNLQSGHWSCLSIWCHGQLHR